VKPQDQKVVLAPKGGERYESAPTIIIKALHNSHTLEGNPMQKFFSSLVFSFCLLTGFVPTATANKPIVAVGDIESSFSNYDTSNIKSAIETSLSQSGKYTLMERGRLDQLLAEQGMAAQGLTSGAGSMGGFDGIDYLIYGRVTQVGLESQNLFVMTQCKANFGIDIRVSDVRSGEIRLTHSVNVEDDVATGGKDDNPCVGVTFDSLTDLSLNAASQIVEALSQNLFPVKIARATQDEVYLNYGEGFLNKGELLKIAILGEGFVDPDTGEVLGAEETIVAIVQVKDVRSKFSIADIIMSNEKLKVGDVANRLSSKDNKRLSKGLKACTKARQKAKTNCDKGKKSCAKDTTKARDACDLIA
jgi:curli biogenesis system outer membrane secretion channel CsgG